MGPASTCAHVHKQEWHLWYFHTKGNISMQLNSWYFIALLLITDESCQCIDLQFSYWEESWQWGSSVLSWAATGRKSHSAQPQWNIHWNWHFCQYIVCGMLRSVLEIKGRGLILRLYPWGEVKIPDWPVMRKSSSCLGRLEEPWRSCKTRSLLGACV